MLAITFYTLLVLLSGGDSTAPIITGLSPWLSHLLVEPDQTRNFNYTPSIH